MTRPDPAGAMRYPDPAGPAWTAGPKPGPRPTSVRTAARLGTAEGVVLLLTTPLSLFGYLVSRMSEPRTVAEAGDTSGWLLVASAATLVSGVLFLVASGLLARGRSAGIAVWSAAVALVVLAGVGWGVHGSGWTWILAAGFAAIPVVGLGLILRPPARTWLTGGIR